MKDTLCAGLKGQLVYTVPINKTVPHLYPEAVHFQQMPEVFATGFLVGLLEWCCLECMIPHLDWPQEQSVGTHVDFSHSAATVPGQTVVVKCEVVEVDGNRVVFNVEATDGIDEISCGRHERYVIQATRFGRGLDEKRSLINSTK